MARRARVQAGCEIEKMLTPSAGTEWFRADHSHCAGSIRRGILASTSANHCHQKCIKPLLFDARLQGRCPRAVNHRSAMHKPIQSQLHPDSSTAIMWDMYSITVDYHLPVDLLHIVPQAQYGFSEKLPWLWPSPVRCGHLGSAWRKATSRGSCCKGLQTWVPRTVACLPAGLWPSTARSRGLVD